MSYEICLIQAQEGNLQPECLNHWPTMRKLCSEHVQAEYGEAPPEAILNMQREMKRLYSLWQRNREAFKIEVHGWFVVNT